MKNCGNISHSTDGEEILVVQRQSQVVRALEAKTGAEKWNFSVAQLDLKLVSECHPSASAKLNYHLKVIIPEGIVYAADNKNPNNIFWRQKV